MRFSIATATILAESFSRVSASSDVHRRAGHLLALDKSEKDELWNTISSFEDIQAIKKKKKKKKSDYITSLLQNKLLQQKSHVNVNTESVVECNPTPSNDGDVGILSCGMNQYCIESTASTLGGICTNIDIDVGLNHNKRILQDTGNFSSAIDAINNICNLGTTDDTVVCEQCSADETTYTGNFKCTYTSNCATIPGLCMDGKTYDFCGEETLEGTVSGPDIYEYTSCYMFKTPAEFTYCEGLSVNGDTVECTLTLNGETCNSCSLYYDPATNDVCQVFDCENTVLGTSGSTCAISFAAALAIGYLYNTLPCENGCSLCGDNRVMGTPGNNFTLDGGYSINCFQTQLAALTGYLAGYDYCTTLMDNVESDCGCTDSAPPGPGPSPSPSAAPTTFMPTTTAVGIAGASMLVTAWAG